MERVGTPVVSMHESLGRRLCTSADDPALPAVVKEGADKTQAAFMKTIDTQLFNQDVVAYQMECFLEVGQN